jgi:phosphoribosylamine--glycine ligase
MRVLVIGNGASEHALATRLSQDEGAHEILCTPGNPGIAQVARLCPVDVRDVDALLTLARREHVDFTVVGPEVPLSLGLVDRFVADGRAIFGPTQRAARLESSKAFAKDFMARHGVPTARFHTCDSADAALEVVRKGAFGFPIVLKADGLAAGKGVVIAETLDAAEEAIDAAMTDSRFGDAGHRLVIEECLTGPEVSFFVISDGARGLPIGTAQDHKRIFDEDKGPNTGGMGAFAPSPLVDEALHRRVMTEIVEPVIAGMAAEGDPFRGFLYVGLMLTAEGPKVIEFNVRLGDPEAQVILPHIAEPPLPLLTAAPRALFGRRRARSRPIGWSAWCWLRAVIRIRQNRTPIAGIADAEREARVAVLHAGTAAKNGQIVTAGGRVLTVVGRAENYRDAIARAYAGLRVFPRRHAVPQGHRQEGTVSTPS